MRIVACFTLSAVFLAAQDLPKSYESVIPKDAVSKRGVFAVHQVRDKLYYEIPARELGNGFLWSVRLARTISGVGIRNSGLGSHTVRWERRGNTILLKKTHYAAVADPAQPIARGIEAVNYPTIVASFPVEALGQAAPQ